VKLRTRFVLATAGVGVVLAAVATPFVLRRAAIELRAVPDRTLGDVALTATGPITALSNREVLLTVVSGYADGGEVGVTVWRDGDEVVTVGTVPAGVPLGPPGFATVTTDDGSWRLLTVAAPPDLRLSPTAADAIRFSMSLAATEAAIAERRRGAAVVSAAIVAGTTFAAAVVARLATRPLVRLRDATAALGDGGDHRVPDASGVDEVDALAGTVNDLVARLAAGHARTVAALESARSFTANAAHELRTPLTGLGANLEVLHTYPGLDPAERAEVVAAAMADTERVQRLLAALRDLARGEQLDPAHFEDVDIGELADAVVAGAARAHPWATIGVDHDPGVVVSGAPEGLRLAVDNLVRNACLHGRADRGRVVVRVRTRRDGDRVELVVDDDGPGLAGVGAEEAFARFVRGATGAPGSGLGLALVRQQAELHGGRVSVAASPLGGCRFRLELPATDPTSATFRSDLSWCSH
jgi:two-component system sensor histidine kinase PrrB